MSLIDRLAGIDESDNNPKISAHYFYAALAEFAAGEVTRPQIEAAFNIRADDGNGINEQNELQVIIDGYTNAPNERKQEYLEFIHRLFMLAESRASIYDTRAEINARIQRF